MASGPAALTSEDRPFYGGNPPTGDCHISPGPCQVPYHLKAKAGAPAGYDDYSSFQAELFQHNRE